MFVAFPLVQWGMIADTEELLVDMLVNIDLVARYFFCFVGQLLYFLDSGHRARSRVHIKPSLIPEWNVLADFLHAV